jgi:predicted flap endonuclease-1-like 5' DNA nuclease
MELVEERAERAWRLPLGVASPLWAVFGAAAGVGVAYWWMTHWTKVVNIEALAAPKPAGPAPADTAPAATAAEVVSETVVAVVETRAKPGAADDLTRLTGIGPKLSAALAGRGVTRFAQIAAWTDADLAAVDAALALKGRAVREAWVAQARRLADG